MILCATNHPQLLDRALYRRFDAVIEYGMPTPQLAEQVIRARLSPLDCSGVDWSAAATAAEGLSHAEVVRACEQAAKNAILAYRTTIDTSALAEALTERRAARG